MLKIATCLIYCKKSIKIEKRNTKKIKCFSKHHDFFQLWKSFMPSFVEHRKWLEELFDLSKYKEDLPGSNVPLDIQKIGGRPFYNTRIQQLSSDEFIHYCNIHLKN